MSPVIRRLKQQFGVPFDAPDYTMVEPLLGPETAYKMVLAHPVLQLEYSVVCNRLLTQIDGCETHEWYQQELEAAILLARILEQLYDKYLNVPRLVRDLREQQEAMTRVLAHLKKDESIKKQQLQAVLVGHSVSLRIRESTAQLNWYRLFLVRCKRFLNAISAFEQSAPWFRQGMGHVDTVANPIISYLAWLFLVPRLLTNLFLLFKHTLGFGLLSPEEQSLGFFRRFIAQLQRRWFELANDLIWVPIGIINCFLLVGPLAPIGIYLNVTFFAYDIVLSALRLFIELGRLISLQQQYTAMLEGADEQEQQNIQEYKQFLTKRIYFELMRLGLHLAITTGIFLSTCLLIPAFASMPVIPLIGAIGLLTISIAGFILTQAVETQRPREQLSSAGLERFGVFGAKKNSNKLPEVTEDKAFEPG